MRNAWILFSSAAKQHKLNCSWLQHLKQVSFKPRDVPVAACWGWQRYWYAPHRLPCDCVGSNSHGESSFIFHMQGLACARPHDAHRGHLSCCWPGCSGHAQDDRVWCPDFYSNGYAQLGSPYVSLKTCLDPCCPSADLWSLARQLAAARQGPAAQRSTRMMTQAVPWQPCAPHCLLTPCKHMSHVSFACNSQSTVQMHALPQVH